MVSARCHDGWANVRLLLTTASSGPFFVHVGRYSLANGVGIDARPQPNDPPHISPLDFSRLNLFAARSTSTFKNRAHRRNGRYDRVALFRPRGTGWVQVKDVIKPLCNGVKGQSQFWEECGHNHERDPSISADVMRYISQHRAKLPDGPNATARVKSRVPMDRMNFWDGNLASVFSMAKSRMQIFGVALGHLAANPFGVAIVAGPSVTTTRRSAFPKASMSSS